MKAATTTYRHFQPSKTEIGIHKKETNETIFFGGQQKQASFFGSANTTFMKRKCETCADEDNKMKRAVDDKKEEEIQRQEEKKEEKVQLKENMAITKEDLKNEHVSIRSKSKNTKTIGSYINGLNGKGQPLSVKQQQFFGSRMGYNFNQVKVHTGKEAADSAKTVNAKAYTVGNNIVFNNGNFNPDTTDGKHLLAHELTHVVQNNTSKGRNTINRVPAGFEIEGVFPDAASFPTTLFFNLGQRLVPSSEQYKIPGIATPPNQNLTLIGTASEEGSPATNLSLINNRINDVDRKLRNAGHTGVRTKTPQPSAGTGNMDYRRVRAVDVIPTPGVVPPGGALPSITPACTATPANPNPELETCGTSFSNAFPNALTWTILAFAKLAMSNASAIAEASNLFPGIAPSVILGHLGNLMGQLARLPSQHRCHNTCDGGCSRPAYNSGTGSSSLMTLCPDYINSANQNEQSETLIHESLHATPGLATRDTAYSTTRLITSLTGPQALINTDSFVLLILRINGIAPPSGAAPADAFGSMTAPEEAYSQTALAYLEQWLLNSEFDTSLLYNAIDSNIGGSGSWNASDNFEAEIAHAISGLVQITDPGSTAPFTTFPVPGDKVKVAGMFDRYTTLRQKVYLNALTVNKIVGGSERWDLSTNTIYVNPGFFGQSGENSVRHLFRLIVRALGNVPGSLANAYVESTNEIRKHRSTGP